MCPMWDNGMEKWVVRTWKRTIIIGAYGGAEWVSGLGRWQDMADKQDSV